MVKKERSKFLCCLFFESLYFFEKIRSIVSGGSEDALSSGCIIGVTLRSLVDLELGEVDEDLLHIGPRERVVHDLLLLEEPSKLAKGLRQGHIAAINVDACDLVAHRDRPRNDLDYSLSWWGCINICGFTVVNQLGSGDVLRHQINYVCLPNVKLFLILLDLDRVAMTVLSLEVVGGAEDNEPAVDHDSNTVTELLGLIHAMRG